MPLLLMTIKILLLPWSYITLLKTTIKFGIDIVVFNC